MMITPKSYRRRLTVGFSLIELLTAMTISSMLLVLLASLLTTSLNRWQRDTNQIQKNVEGGASLELIKRDLQSIVPKSDGAEWLHVSQVQVDNLGTKPWLMFLATAQEHGTTGDHGSSVCAISWRLEKQVLPGSDDSIHALYRKALPPTETIKHLGAEDLMTEIWIGREDETTTADSLVATHIVDFELIFTIRTPTGGVESISTQSLRLTKGTSKHSKIPTGSIVESVEIRCTSLDRDGQYRLNDEGDRSLAEIILKHGQDYRAFIEFPTQLP